MLVNKYINEGITYGSNFIKFTNETRLKLMKMLSIPDDNNDITKQ